MSTSTTAQEISHDIASEMHSVFPGIKPDSHKPQLLGIACGFFNGKNSEDRLQDGNTNSPEYSHITLALDGDIMLVGITLVVPADGTMMDGHLRLHTWTFNSEADDPTEVESYEHGAIFDGLGSSPIQRSILQVPSGEHRFQQLVSRMADLIDSDISCASLYTVQHKTDDGETEHPISSVAVQEDEQITQILVSLAQSTPE